MELDDMAQPLTKRQLAAFEHAMQWADLAASHLFQGDIRGAAKCYEAAARVRHLRDRSRLALAMTAADLWLEWLKTQPRKPPTMH